MTIVSSAKHVGDAAIEQLAARFPELPKPLLAAIGAGDVAVERLATLRESFVESLPGRPGAGRLSTPAIDPKQLQKVAADVAEHLQEFAATAPAKAAKLIEELPGKASEFAEGLNPEHARETVEAYTQFVGMIYGNLAQRGSETVAKVKSASAPATVVDAPSEPTRTTSKAAASKVDAPKAAPARQASAAAKARTTHKPATAKAAPKPAAKSAVAHKAPAKPASAPKSAAAEEPVQVTETTAATSES